MERGSEPRERLLILPNGSGGDVARCAFSSITPVSRAPYGYTNEIDGESNHMTPRTGQRREDVIVIWGGAKAKIGHPVAPGPFREKYGHNLDM